MNWFNKQNHSSLASVADAKPAYSSFVTVNNSVNLVSSLPTNDSKPTLCRNQDTPDIACGQKVPNKQEEDQDMLRQKLIDLQRQLSRSDYDAFLQEYLRDFEAARNQLCANSGAGLDLTSKGNHAICYFYFKKLTILNRILAVVTEKNYTLIRYKKSDILFGSAQYSAETYLI